MEMKLTNSILRDIRESVGLSPDASEFDTELLMHINTSIVKLNQNGVGNLLIVTNEDSTWNDLMDPNQINGNKSFPAVPLFIQLNTKLLFDPPPPSTVQYYSGNAEEILWRLKIAYELG